MSARGVGGWLAGIVVVVLLLGAVRCGGRWRAEEAAAIGALQDTVATLRAQLAREAATRDSLIRVAAATAPQHARDTLATRRAQAALTEAIADARAIAERDSLDLDDARATIRRLADRADSLNRRITAERASSTIRIGAQERAIVHVQLTATTVDSLVAKQTALSRAALAKRPWYRRAIGEGCAAGVTGSGAAVGAVVGGPLGAGIGGAGGYVVGRLSCR